VSYLVKNIRRLGRDLRDEPLSRLPHKLWTVGRSKLGARLEAGAMRTGLGGVLGKACRGPGVALMFHEIQGDPDHELRTGCDAVQLARIIQAVRVAGRDIVTVDEALRRLNDPEPRPFALLTFDDGYRDTQTVALPVLERCEAPMTVFVPTAMITRQIDAWWLALRQAVRLSRSLEVPPMHRTFSCADLPSKTAVLRQISGWIGTDQHRAGAISAVLADLGIDTAELVNRYAMGAAELKDLAAHPLVTIGAHTQSHRFLTALSEEEVLAEFLGNKAYLEGLLEKPVDYLAYPFGSEGACGAREARLAADAGYRASFTTRPGHLFADHLADPQLLPRIDVGYGLGKAAIGSRLSGLHRVMTAGFGRPVATLS